MEWRHEVSSSWLKARKNCLTATEAVKLISETKKNYGKDRFGPVVIGIIADKMDTNEPDTKSFGAAARGHCLEPYALSEFNDIKDLSLYHWDDAIIIREDLNAGFSPDALSIEHPYCDDVIYECSKIGYINRKNMRTIGNASMICEIKSYESKHHIQCCLSDKFDLDERFQLAYAMLLAKIQKGYLVFYNPSSPVGIKYFEYSYEELHDEMKILSKCIEYYNDALKYIDENLEQVKTRYTEQEIFDDIFAEDTFTV